MPYALSWWLDVVEPRWDALIMGDYEAVMPLTWNRKFGIPYLYQPFFTQQLGVFSPKEINPKQTCDFLAAIPERFKYIDINLNSQNYLNCKDFQPRLKKNYTLDLSPSYDKLFASYHKSFRRNISKVTSSDLSVKPGPDAFVFVNFIQNCLNEKLAAVKKNFYEKMQKIIDQTLRNGTGKILGAYDLNGNLLAAGWFIESSGRYTLPVSASTPEGKKQLAIYLLIDHEIRLKAESGLIFDFEGSNIPGIAYFNSGFGAKESTYPAILKNNLPWILRLFKR